jgi:hypothetical protein
MTINVNDIDTESDIVCVCISTMKVLLCVIIVWRDIVLLYYYYYFIGIIISSINVKSVMVMWK